MFSKDVKMLKFRNDKIYEIASNSVKATSIKIHDLTRKLSLNAMYFFGILG